MATVSKQMKQWRVTVDMYRETWSGRDQFDGERTVTVEAANAKSAIAKAKKLILNPGKGARWSHSIWTRNERAELAN